MPRRALNKAPKLKRAPRPAEPQNAREGNADLIRGVGIFDTPDPGTGNALLGCPFPGNATLVVYPNCDFTIDAGGMVISLDDSDQPLRLKTRPRVAAIELKGDEVRFHPPAADPLPRAIARVCEQFAIDARDPLAVMKLVPDYP